MSNDEIQKRMNFSRELQAQIRQAQKRTEKSLAELAISQASTDERLNCLIHVVEKYFRGKQNGNQPDHG